MRRQKRALPPKQMLSEEIVERLLAFIESKFYSGDRVRFLQDRKRLLSWVVLRFAAWLNSRGVTLPGERYFEVVNSLLMEAVRHGNTGNISYRPAWLAKVVESHLAVHGDELYEEAKSMRNLAEHCLIVAGASRGHAPDPVGSLAQAARLLTTRKPARKPGVKEQLELL